jgi:hypothetical protein
MTQTVKYAYKIAAGYNNAGSLVNIETIVPTGDSAFWPPEGYGGYRPGESVVRADGTEYVAGFASTVWHFKRLTRAQYSYLQSTYCGGGWSGKVTIATRIGATSYANYNAILWLPKPADANRTFIRWIDIDLRFTRMVAL